MKKYLLILFACLILPFSAAGQAKIVTKRAKIADMADKTVKIVLTGNELIDTALKTEVKSRWVMSPFEYCSISEFNNLMSNPEYYFLTLVETKTKNEDEPGIDVFYFAKGDPKAINRNMNNMLEVVSVPFAASGNPSGKELIFLPAILDIIQNYSRKAMLDDVLIYTGLSNFAKNISKASAKNIYFSEDDLSDEIDKDAERMYFNNKVHKVSDDKAASIFGNTTSNSIVSYVIAPENPVKGSFCYKMLIDSETHELYYFRKHKISKKRGPGFLLSDIKRISKSVK